jgi:GNAT superfamily N-acetyltransferase
MAGGLEIRRARPEELDACADLYLRVLVETFTWIDPAQHDRRDFLSAAREEEIYVALENGRLVGLAGYYPPMRFIHSLYVAERGRGIGKALLDRLVERAGGAISLKVQAKNRRAQDFYAREGFTAVERGRDPDSDVVWIRMVRSRLPFSPPAGRR